MSVTSELAQITHWISSVIAWGLGVGMALVALGAIYLIIKGIIR